MHFDRPTAMRFFNCNNLYVSGLKHINSQKNHVSINGCNGVTIEKLHIIAPERSPNTDGIDISFSTSIQIHNCTIKTGDDCIAINGGTSNVNITQVACGPGHGISVGSLGHNGAHDEVQGILVNKCCFNGTRNGARIKTWQGGSGFARNISFSDITLIAADNPIIIDQFYCNGRVCKPTNESAVQVSDVTYTGIQGTTVCKKATINFSCSDTVPCTNITLNNINITSAAPNSPLHSRCINAQVTAHLTEPP
ncbi:probable polygalacturonase At3g15720, partial [Olea europaea var. sylvestris]|uniref:probable polygalacturonase At3g15720 n=1 Tax=Olea europaea var. sylvestris TaxID=158386 RepID=UPI000C1D641F